METEGRVIESLPNLLYKVECPTGIFICYVSGKMRINKIHVILGDRVKVKLDPHGGKATNRIIKRM